MKCIISSVLTVNRTHKSVNSVAKENTKKKWNWFGKIQCNENVAFTHTHTHNSNNSKCDEDEEGYDDDEPI